MRISEGGELATLAAADHAARSKAGALANPAMQSDRVVEAVPRQQSLETLFNSLVAEWRQSVTPSTTLSSLLAHPAYNRIVGMGLLASNAVVPLILKDLSTHPRQWFQALQEIAGEDPVPAEAKTFEEFRQAWLSWGAASGGGE